MFSLNKVKKSFINHPGDLFFTMWVIGNKHFFKVGLKDTLPWNISQLIMETIPNQQEKSHKLCNQTGHPVFSLLESQWKLRQQHDQNFPTEGKPL